jgi:prophage regulatory protein
MKLLRVKEVIQVTGLSRMTIYRLERSGQFPKRRRIGQNSVAWLDDDLALWVNSRPVIQPREGGTDTLVTRRDST